MVSIVIPVYNSEKYLEACLNSVLNQTYENLEIICVNDESTDKSLSILEKYSLRDSRIKLISKKNDHKGGAASARNLGMDNAYGKYIMFLDSDDFFEEDMISLLVNRIEETASQLVICKANRYDNVTDSKAPYYPIDFSNVPKKDVFSFEDCSKDIFDIGNNITWNKMYRLDFLRQEELRFESIPISDDQYVPVMALLLAKRITVVDKALINYRVNTGNSQVDTHHLHPDSSYKATYSIIKRMRELGIYDDVKQPYLNMSFRLMREYFDKMVTYDSLKYLYEKYRNEVIPFFEAENLTEDFFFDKRLWKWYQLIMTTSLNEILLQSARGFGDGKTTSILRFQFPYERVRRNSSIVLLGKGIAGKYFYSQILLSDYCKVAAWVNDEEEIPENLIYDEIIKAD